MKYDCTVIKWISIPRFKGINSNQSFRDKSGSGSGTSNGGHRRELRHRKSSNTDQEKNLTDDEIVESCKVKIVLQTFYFSAQLQFSRWHMTPQAVSTGAPVETLPREWWPDRWGVRTPSWAQSRIMLYCGHIIYPDLLVARPNPILRLSRSVWFI